MLITRQNPEALRERIRQVKEELASLELVLQASIGALPDEQLLTGWEICSMLRISRAELRKMVSNNQVPYVVLPNGETRFSRSAVMSKLNYVTKTKDKP